MAVLAIDMDGTIVNFASESFRRAEELYGIKMTKKDAYKPKTAELLWERMTNEQKSKFTDHREIYEEICGDGFFECLEPFPKAIEAIKELYAEGHEIIFLTKVLNWNRSAKEKAVWLKKYFSDIKYTTMMVDSIKAKHLVNADYIIDDDIRVLQGAIAKPICIAQPWNEDYRKGLPILVAKEFIYAAEMIKKFEEQLGK